MCPERGAEGRPWRSLKSKSSKIFFYSNLPIRYDCTLNILNFSQPTHMKWIVM